MANHDKVLEDKTKLPLDILLTRYPNLDREFVQKCLNVAALGYLFARLTEPVKHAETPEEQATVLCVVQAPQAGPVQPVEAT